MKTLFIVTHNIAGYMPESDPVAFESFADAKGYVIDEMRDAADHVEPGTPDPWGDHWAIGLIACANELETIGSLVSGDEPLIGWSDLVETGPGPTHLDQCWAITKTIVSDEEAAELMGEIDA